MTKALSSKLLGSSSKAAALATQEALNERGASGSRSSKGSKGNKGSKDQELDGTLTMPRLLHLLRKSPFRWNLLATVCSLSYISMDSFVQPYCFGRMLDALVPSSRDTSQNPQADSDPMYFWLTCIAAACVTAWLVRQLEHVVFTITSAQVRTQLQTEALQAVLCQDAAFHDACSVGDLTARVLQSTQKLEDLVTHGPHMALKALLKVVGGVCIMGWTHPQLLAVVAASAPLVVFLSKICGRFHKQIAIAASAKIATCQARATEAISQVRTVQVHGAQLQEVSLFRDALEESNALTRQWLLFTTVTQFFPHIAAYIQHVLLLAVGVAFIRDGSLTVGQLIQFIKIFETYQHGFKQFANLHIQISQAGGDCARYFQVVDRKPLVPTVAGSGSAPAECHGVVRFNDVAFAYHEAQPVLSGINFTAAPGQLIALVGLSGSGKSTITKLLLRLYDPTAGAISIDGQPLPQLDVGWLRQHFAYVDQDPVLFDRSVADNIWYGMTGEPNLSAVKAAAMDACIHDTIMALPFGYDTLLGERGLKLSGGQRQRIAIARAIVRNPKILVLDEATSALDAASERTVQDALTTMHDRTLLVVAHRLSTVINATTILVVHEGQIVQTGTHRELLQDPTGIYSTFIHHQLTKEHIMM